MQPSRILPAKQIVGVQCKLSDTSLSIIFLYRDISCGQQDGCEREGSSGKKILRPNFRLRLTVS